MLQIEPGPYTLRELLWMVDTLRCEQWDHTASLLCQSANINRGPKSPAVPFERCHPYLERRTRKPPRGMTVAQIHAFAHVLPVVHVTLPKTES